MVYEVKNIKIGNISLKNNLFLAPMEGFTNVAFRKNLIQFKVGMVFTEMISASALSKDSNYCKNLLYRDPKESYVAYQLFGNNTSDFVKSAEKLIDRADIININAGCPVDKVLSQGAGCALLKRKNKLYEILKELKKNTEIPITIKIRVGYTKPEHLDYDLLYSYGCDAIFIHSRTCKQKYAGKINVDFLKEAKEKSNFPIIGNGDICTIKDVENMYADSKVDGFMIGRASLYNPKVFEDIVSGNYSKDWTSTLSWKEKILFLDNYYKDLCNYELKAPFVKAKALSVFLFKYAKSAKKLRELIIKTNNFNDLLGLLKGWDNGFME